VRASVETWRAQKWVFALGLLAALFGPCSAWASQPAPEVYQVRLHTTEGVVVVAVHRDWAPHGADRFHALVSEGFYDNTAFFRVIKGFMAQFGLPGDPELAATWHGARIPDDPVRKSNTRGRLSFAAGGPGSRTTQVFVNLADNTTLDAQGFAPFGEVVEGMRVIDKLFRRYGDASPRGRGPSQGQIRAEGEVYLAHFPKLDRIEQAVVVP
jgi:peptidyl-prolyl cis-trans isomerase A (cyclophilin A)